MIITQSHNIVAIYSRQLKPHEQRYPVYKKELLGMIMCLRKFHTYILGHKAVTVLTDHKPLIHIMNQTQLSLALQQWLDVTLNYDIVIKYRPGTLHIIPDALSRMYMSAYGEGGKVWGTVDNIKILQAFDRFKSPSDVLCVESIRAATVPTAVKPRHRHSSSIHPHTSTGGGENGDRGVLRSNYSPVFAPPPGDSLYDSSDGEEELSVSALDATLDFVYDLQTVCEDTIDDRREMEDACTYALY
jgi:hypothetical protein